MLQHRYIDNRMGDFYMTVFGSTYFDDLKSANYSHVVEMLKVAKTARDRFSHGHPTAIDETVIRSVVENLEAEHNGWIAVFNQRVAMPQF